MTYAELMRKTGRSPFFAKNVAIGWPKTDFDHCGDHECPAYKEREMLLPFCLMCVHRTKDADFSDFFKRELVLEAMRNVE